MNEPDLQQFGLVVAKDVNRTVGGGMAAMELMRRTFAARGWIDAGTHGLLVAVSRLTPGTNVLAYCAAAGWRLRRWPGVVVALLGASVPGSLLILALSAALVRLDRFRAVRVLLAFGTIAASLLVLSSGWHLIRPYLTKARYARAIVLVAAALLLFAAGLTPVRVLLIVAVGAAAWPSRPEIAASR